MPPALPHIPFALPGTPVSEIMGLSAAQMLARDEVTDRLEKEAKEKVFQRAEHVGRGFRRGVKVIEWQFCA